MEMDVFERPRVMFIEDRRVQTGPVVRIVKLVANTRVRGAFAQRA